MLLPVAYGFDMLDHESQDMTEFRSCMHQWKGMERNVQKVEKVGMCIEMKIWLAEDVRFSLAGYLRKKGLKNKNAINEKV